MNYCYYQSPVGKLLLVGNEDGLMRIGLPSMKKPVTPQSDWHENAGHFEEVIRQLDEYFQGQRTTFDVKLNPEGTAFQNEVWQSLLEIPYGKTCSYQDLARKIKRPKAARAVGSANGKNPLPIIIPCHRVIANNGSLAGYAGGMDTKQKLIELESAGTEK